jgi:hypothetical protein
MTFEIFCAGVPGDSSNLLPDVREHLAVITRNIEP